jgi:hypothetical protein
MKPDQPHIFEPMPEVPIPYARTGPLGVRPDQWGRGKRLCQVCRKPETDMVHQAAERATQEPEHWG